jgi:glucosyl-dolichyl phosphate glucuronosyltransferase
MPGISVILCTFNRSKSLLEALESVARSAMPKSLDWEVLVVDNNSRDETRTVVQGFCQRFPDRFRYLFEPQQGKSYALNTGIREARGDILAFIDDDVIVEPEWLYRLTANLGSGKWAGAAGRIVPKWPGTPPNWVPLNEWYGMAPLVGFDLGSEARQLTDPPFGANMAFHRKMFEKHGTFRTDLGPGLNGKVRNNEDTEFGRRLLAAGERLRYEPAAVVNHAVSPDRMSQSYFSRWWFNKGRSDIRESGIPSDTTFLLRGIPYRFLRQVPTGILRWMVTLRPASRFTRKLALCLLAGKIAECYSRQRKTGEHTQIELTAGPRP